MKVQHNQNTKERRVNLLQHQNNNNNKKERTSLVKMERLLNGCLLWKLYTENISPARVRTDLLLFGLRDSIRIAPLGERGIAQSG